MADHNEKGKNPFSIIGLAHKFFLAFWAAGGTTDDANKMAETPNLLRDIIKVLRGEAEIVPVIFSQLSTFPTWRKVTVGTYKTVADLCAAAVCAGAKIEGLQAGCCKKLTLISTQEELELVLVSVESLGFKKEGATRAEIYERALSLGLRLCPPEIALLLRLEQHMEQGREWVLIAMEVIDVSHTPNVFRVHMSHDVNWLDTENGRPDCSWSAKKHWVFLQKLKS